MTRTMIALAALAGTTSLAHAGGIDRSGQGLGPLFEKGTYLELSFGNVSPSVGGQDVLGNRFSDVAPDYSQSSISYKQDINRKLSFAVILDQPFGADISYGGDRATTLLGGTIAQADAAALTGLLRYKFNENFSVHGGVRAQKADAFIQLSGQAYGGVNGYNVSLDSDVGYGYVIGVAYEKPEIALRIAVTYNSSITHNFDTVEDFTGTGLPFGTTTSVTEVTLPQSVNLDFQTGVAKDTLVFGQVRWVDWNSLTLRPATFVSLPNLSAGLIDLDTTTTFTLGVGRKFNETWSGAFSVNYEREQDPLVSPLAPTNGRVGATLAVIYTKDNLKITSGISYTEPGDALPETGTPDVQRGTVSGSSAFGFGFKVGYAF